MVEPDDMIRAPAPRPCTSCPYRQDVPSGMWSREDYERLPRYDAPTYEQPGKVFLCHQHDLNSPGSRVCAGWAGCHDGEHLLGLRIAVAEQRMAVETAQAVRDYVSPVPLFSSGHEAMEHGVAEIDEPGERAFALMDKIERVRRDLKPS